ncbi:MAG: hypothetical protein M0P31_14060 [Solirubrobacteraceae bacterium]|nr:hypothetical protein [Solirubrobacteraceae bacterium]
MRRPRAPRLTYANVVATLALFIALGGTTVAATKLHGKDIRRGTITGTQVRSGSVPGSDLRRGSVTGRQVRESSLSLVPRAALADRATLAGHAAAADRAGAAGHADTAGRASDADRATTAASAGTATRATSADRADRAVTADRSTTADRATDADTLDGRAAADYLDRCPAGTRAYAGSCFESAPRAAATWPDAAEACGDAGGRLPGLDELEGFRQEPGVTLGSPEHSSAYLDTNGVAAGGELTVGMHDNGARAPGHAYGTSSASYRCVMPATNR